MIRRASGRLRGRAGMTLSELLIVLIILGFVTAILAAGLPTAIGAYRKISDAANAQVLLSTTMTRLRTELGTATELEVPEGGGAEIRYRNSSGSMACIYGDYREDGGTEPGLVIVNYAPDQAITRSEASRPVRLTVKDWQDREMYPYFSGVAYDRASGVVTITGLSVRVTEAGGTERTVLTLADPDDSSDMAFEVRVLLPA